MSLVDDQIINDSNNALDELSKRINRVKNPIEAAIAVSRFEEDMIRTKEDDKNKKNGEGKTIIDPEKILREIQDDMER